MREAHEQRSWVLTRDGVKLATRVFVPRGRRRAAAVVYRTPYGMDAELGDNLHTFEAVIARGLVLVVQDVRGRYESEGVFVPYRNEGRDGFDTIEWAAGQPWCNRRVATLGLSYPGAVQWLAAAESPPHLLAMVPAMAFSRPDHFVYFGGAFDLSWPRWAARHILPDARRRLGLPDLDAEAVTAGATELPLGQHGALLDTLPWYREWLEHPPDDEWWTWCDLRSRYVSVRAAVLCLSGWHDEAYGPIGAIENFTGLVTARGGARGCELLLGPWTHGVDAVSTVGSGERLFGPSAALDYDKTVLDFLEFYLNAPEQTSRPASAVKAYVMGADRWAEAEAWPPPTRYERWWVGPRGLQDETPIGVTTIQCDPCHLPSARSDLSYGAGNVAEWLCRRDVACFDGPAFRTAVDILGAIETVLYVSADAPSFDVYAWLLDVAPDGTALTLSSPGNVLRRVSRYPVFGEVVELTLRNQVTGHRFQVGHRARLAVAGGLAGALAPNLQTGASEVRSSRARTARVSIHHSARYPSRVAVPLLVE